MKKLSITLILIMSIASVFAQEKASPKGGQKLESIEPQPFIELPAPQRKGGLPLYEALNMRQTNRKFAEKPLNIQQISDLLWCANGVNREDGKRTAPSARNAREIEILVFMEKGVYLYIPDKHGLQMLFEEDMRGKVSSRSDMPEKAPVCLLFAANRSKMDGFDEDAVRFYGCTDAGYVSQNVYLYCAANKLNTVVMGAIDRDALREVLPFDGDPVLAQPVGYPVEK